MDGLARMVIGTSADMAPTGTLTCLLWEVKSPVAGVVVAAYSVKCFGAGAEKLTVRSAVVELVAGSRIDVSPMPTENPAVVARGRMVPVP